MIDKTLIWTKKRWMDGVKNTRNKKNRPIWMAPTLRSDIQMIMKFFVFMSYRCGADSNATRNRGRVAKQRASRHRRHHDLRRVRRRARLRPRVSAPTSYINPTLVPNNISKKLKNLKSKVRYRRICFWIDKMKQ